MCDLHKSHSSLKQRGRPNRRVVLAAVWPHIPRVLHTWLVHCRQKADMPLLQGESRSEMPVSDAMGKTAYTLRKSARLDSISGRLAARHHHTRTGNKLDGRFRIVAQLTTTKNSIVKNN